MTEPTATTANTPTHRLYRVTDEGKTTTWTQIGVAWPNRDGLGFSLTCEAPELPGRIIMRQITARDQAASKA